MKLLSTMCTATKKRKNRKAKKNLIKILCTGNPLGKYSQFEIKQGSAEIYSGFSPY